MSLNKDKMLIMPAVDIRDGKCVQLVQGKPGSEMVVIENPEKVAKSWEDSGAEIVHIIDLDGAIDGNDNLNTIKKIIDTVNVPIQLGGGIRTMEYAKKLLDLDIERLIFGTIAIENPQIISDLSKKYGSDRIMVSLDSKDSKVVIKGWKEKISKSAPELAKCFENKGAGSILFTNVDVEGLLGGFNLDPVTELLNATDIPVVYSGGITSIDDVKKIAKTDVSGIVIGSALYKNKLDLEDALKYQKK